MRPTRLTTMTGRIVLPASACQRLFEVTEMTTLVNAYPFTHFFLGKIDPADVADVSSRRRLYGHRGRRDCDHRYSCYGLPRLFAYAIGSFNDTEGRRLPER